MLLLLGAASCSLSVCQVFFLRVTVGTDRGESALLCSIPT